MNLDEIRATLLDGRTKGIPAGMAPFALSELAGKGWNLLAGDLPFPQMVLRRDSLDHNIRVFGDYLAGTGASFAPHGKTTMAPQLFDEQLRAGAWAITAATIQQAEVMRHFGVPRVILANQLIGPATIRGAAALMAGDDGFELYAYVDSPAQLAQITAGLDGIALARPIRLLLEVGIPGGRTGLRTDAEAAALAEALAGIDPAQLRFAGVACFEGVIPGGDDQLHRIRGFADRVASIASALPPALLEGLGEFILSGGGSAHFDVIADRFAQVALPVPVRVVLRSGCYITTDHGGYLRAQEAARLDPSRSWNSRLEPAMEAWGMVQSVPEPGLALLTMGKRDLPYDSALPVPLKLYRPGQGFLPVGTSEIRSLNDQHAFARLGSDASWQVGDLVACGISHPCTAFDKWRFLPVVDSDYRVVDGVLTFF